MKKIIIINLVYLITGILILTLGFDLDPAFTNAIGWTIIITTIFNLSLDLMGYTKK